MPAPSGSVLATSAALHLVLFGAANLGHARAVPEGLVRRPLHPAIDPRGGERLLDPEGAMQRSASSFATTVANVATFDRARGIVWRPGGALGHLARRAPRGAGSEPDPR